MKNTLIGPESGRMEAVHLVHFLDSFLDIPGAAWDLDLLIYLFCSSRKPSEVRGIRILAGAGADLARVHIIQGRIDPQGEVDPFDPASDIDLLRETAEAIGKSKEWTTAGCLGQMAFDKAQAETLGQLFELSDEAVAWLQIVPYKGSLPTAVPTDPLIYRWYELVNVYGTTIKELIHEEFGDGIMSAIDFSMDIQRQSDPKGDRVNVVLSGKFLPYKSY